ncbi:MAG: endo alpha-1,4 polygalactosaminidase [Bacteriovoracaceae bacterium]
MTSTKGTFIKLMLFFLPIFLISCKPEYPTINTILNVKKIEVVSGEINKTDFKSLEIRDQQEMENNWDKFIEFSPKTYKTFESKITFHSEKNFKKEDFKSLIFKINFFGASLKYQTWNFSIFNNKSQSYEQLFNNNFVENAKWNYFEFAKNDITDYINSKNDIIVQLNSNNDYDVALIDYLVITLETKLQNTTPTPNPDPTDPSIPQTGWTPKINQKWHIQYSGTIDLSELNPNTEVIILDLFKTDKELIDTLKKSNLKIICSFSVGTYDPNHPDADEYHENILGNNLNGSPDIRWVDIRNLETLRAIMGKRMDLAVEKSCDGVLTLAMENFAFDTGFPIKYRDQLEFNLMLAEMAHARALSIGLHNDFDQIPELKDSFDWAFSEQCFEFNKCNKLLPLVDIQKPVFGVEYNLSTEDFCPKANVLNFDFVRKNIEMDATSTPCR